MATPDTSFIKQFSDTIMLLVRQFDSRLSGAVMVDNNFKSEMKLYDRIGTFTLTELGARYQDTPLLLPDHTRRALVPSYFAGATLEDPKDALQMLIDPKSAYMQSLQAAANQKKDDIIITAMGGAAATGKTGSGSQAFAAASQIAVTYGSGASNSGLTKAKVLRAKQKLDANEVNKEDRFAVTSSKQIEDLLNTTEVASSDYNVIKALVQGEIDTWVGFKFLHSERLLTSASHRLCYFWQRKAVQFAMAKEAEGRIDIRVDKNMAKQVYIALCMGAVRMEEERIIEVTCAET